MSDILTRGDSLRLYLSGAAFDGASQSVVTACLGGYRSSSQAGGLGMSVTSPISNVTVEFASGFNGTGAGTLAAYGSDNLIWTPPGGTAGPATEILEFDTKIIEGGGSDGASKFLRVTRSSSSAMSGTATVTLTDVFNNAIGYSNVASALAASGGNKYWAVFLKNVSSTSISSLKLYVKALGSGVTSNVGNLGSSGAGTVSTSGSLSSWPTSGFARIDTSGGTLREIVYYSSRTSSQLTVPSAGRGQLGTSAGAGASTDTVTPVPGIRLASETPVSSAIQTIGNDTSAPIGVSWNSELTAAAGIDCGDVAAGSMIGLWIHRPTVTGTVGAASILNQIGYEFEAVG